MCGVCFALKNNGGCKVLTVRKCVYPNCSFMKTFEQVSFEMLAVSDRLNSLDYYHQQYIANKYYDGNIWWHAVKVACM